MQTPPAEDPNKTSHFDADASAAAQEEPTLMVGHYLYRGRLLSIEEWLPFWERLTAIRMKHGKSSTEDMSAAVTYYRELTVFYRAYLRVVFPRRRFKFWAPDPVKHLMAQPFSVVEEAMVRFFFLQVRATSGNDVVKEEPATRFAPPGTPSQPRTPSGPEAT